MITIYGRLEARRIFRHQPKVSGVSVLLLFNLIYLAPWRRIGFFDNTAQATLTLSVLFALLTSAMLSSDSGPSPQTAFWLRQKGTRVGEAALLSATVTFAAIAVLLVVSGVFAAIGLAMWGDVSLAAVFAIVAASFLVALVTHSLVCLMNAYQVARKSEILVATALLSLLQGLLVSRMPNFVQSAIHLILPPFSDCFQLLRAINANDGVDSMAAGTHLLVFCAVCFALAYRRYEHKLRL